MAREVNCFVESLAILKILGLNIYLPNLPNNTIDVSIQLKDFNKMQDLFRNYAAIELNCGGLVFFRKTF